MMPEKPLHHLFSYLCMHAKVHSELTTIDTRYRRLLQTIEKKEIQAYADDTVFERLEALKEELLSIRFVQKEDLTDPSP